MFVVHTSNCHGQNCIRRAIYRLGIDTLIANILVHFSLEHFIPAWLAFVVLGLVSSVPSQEVGWEEHLRNDLFCVEWDAKP